MSDGGGVGLKPGEFPGVGLAAVPCRNGVRAQGRPTPSPARDIHRGELCLFFFELKMRFRPRDRFPFAFLFR